MVDHYGRTSNEAYERDVIERLGRIEAEIGDTRRKQVALEQRLVVPLEKLYVRGMTIAAIVAGVAAAFVSPVVNWLLF